MKAMRKIVIAAAALCMVLAGCGTVDNSSSGTGAKTSAPVAEGQTEQSTEPEEGGSEVTSAEDSEETETQAAVTEAVTSEADGEEPTATTPAEIITMAPEEAGPFDPYQVSDYVFENDFGSYTYGELFSMGLANRTTDKDLYCLVPDGAAAGSVYYDTYCSADGGVTWTRNEGYMKIANGSNYWYALDDGRLMAFRVGGADYDGVPHITFVACNPGTVPAAYESDIDLDGLTFSDGHYIEHGDFSYSYDAGYYGGTTIGISAMDNETGYYTDIVYYDLNDGAAQ
ncbi:MAG: hypothetical protein IJ806_10185 [Ruminococcus sp.]|nr:hypothetical protein [Ruminococcus sp.]